MTTKPPPSLGSPFGASGGGSRSRPSLAEWSAGILSAAGWVGPMSFAGNDRHNGRSGRAVVSNPPLIPVLYGETS